MVEIQIRNLTTKKAELISNLLACLSDSFESNPKAYKNEFGEEVTEVFMNRLNRKCVNALKKSDKEQKDSF